MAPGPPGFESQTNVERLIERCPELVCRSDARIRRSHAADQQPGQGQVSRRATVDPMALLLAKGRARATLLEAQPARIFKTSRAYAG